MDKRNIKLVLAVAAILLVAFFWGDFSPASNKGIPEVDQNIVIQKTDEDRKLDDDHSMASQDSKTELEKALEDELEKEEVEKEDMELAKEDLEDKKEEPAPSQEEKKEEETEETRVVTKAKEEKALASQAALPTVSLKVSAKTLVNNKDQLDGNKEDLLPKNGLIYSNDRVEVEDGDTVFDVLLREMQAAGIHMESSMTPIYKTNYVEGINNIYEFDAGELSGWMYKVNGSFPSYGASEVELKAGDRIEWLYTCDLGKDIGGKNATGGRR